MDPQFFGFTYEKTEKLVFSIVFGSAKTCSTKSPSLQGSKKGGVTQRRLRQC